MIYQRKKKRTYMTPIVVEKLVKDKARAKLQRRSSTKLLEVNVNSTNDEEGT